MARPLAADDGEAEEEGSAPEHEEKRVKRKLTISKELTPLQQKLEKLAEVISRVGYLAAGLIFFAQLFRGGLTGEGHWPAARADAGHGFCAPLDYFVPMGLILALAVPEGLPLD